MVVNTQSSTEFWNSIFFHNEFFHTTYESDCSKCKFPEISVLDSVWIIVSKIKKLLIAIIHSLNQLPQCDLQPVDCQTRFCKCYFRRSRDFKGAPTPEHKIILASYTPQKTQSSKNDSRLKCLKISLSLCVYCVPKWGCRFVWPVM